MPADRLADGFRQRCRSLGEEEGRRELCEASSVGLWTLRALRRRRLLYIMISGAMRSSFFSHSFFLRCGSCRSAEERNNRWGNPRLCFLKLFDTDVCLLRLGEEAAQRGEGQACLCKSSPFRVCACVCVFSVCLLFSPLMLMPV